MHTQDDLYASTVVSHIHKYKGLIRRRIIKTYRDEIFRFFDYLYTMSSSHEKIVNILRTLHFAQIFLMSLCPHSQVFWPHDSVLGKVINIIAVSANLCTPQSSEFAHMTIALVMYSIIFLMTLFLFISAFIFHKYTKVNQHVINFYCIYLSAFIPYLMLYIGSNIGREISVICRYYIKSFKYELEESNEIKLQITCLSIGLLLGIILLTIHLLFVTPVLSFRSQSVHFLNSKAAFIYLVSYFFTSVLLSLAGNLNNYIILFFTLIPLVFLHVLTYSHIEVWGTFEFRQTSLSILETILILLLVEYFLLIFKIKMNEILLLIVIVFFVLFSYFYSQYDFRTRQKFLALCTRIQNEPEIFEHLTENNALLLLRIGFEMGHKLCHSWTAFEYADKKFPNNRRILFLILRYSILYPEEHLLLRVVINKISRHKKKSLELKFLIFQIHSLFQQRERGLSKSLKKMLAHIDNKTDKCRNQIRQIWTSIIQGDILSVEDLSYELKKNADEITREYNQLCISYPNNPYVVSSYSAFLSDIWCKEKEAMILRRIYKLLRNGGKARIEKAFFFAKELFQYLPNEEQHNIMNRKDNDENEDEPKMKSIFHNSIISMSVDNNYEINKEEVTLEKSQQKYLEALVESIHFSSLRYGPCLIFIIISIFFPLLSIFFAFFVTNKMSANMNGVHFIEKQSLQKATISHISIAFYYYVLSSNRLVSSFFDILSLKISSLDHLLSLAKYNEELLNDMNEVFPPLYKTGYFDDSLNFLFNDSIIAHHIFSNFSYGLQQHSYEFYMAQVGESVLRVAPLKAIKLLNMLDFWSLIYSYPNFLNQTDAFSIIQMRDMDKMVVGNFMQAFNVVVSTGLLSLALFLFIIVFVFRKMSIEKEALFMSFKSLPKSAISATIAKLNAQLGRHDDIQENQFFSPQEERAFRLLTMNNNRIIVNSYDSFIISVLVIVIICVLTILFFLVRSQKKIINELPRLCNVMLSASSLHSTFAAIILNQARIVAYKQKQIPINSLQTKEELIQYTNDLFVMLRKKVQNFRFGDHSFNGKSQGLFGFSDDFIHYFTNASMLSYNINCSLNSSSNIYDYSIIKCISLENSMSHVILLLNYLFNQIIHYSNDSIPLNHQTFAISIRWLFNISFPEIVLKTIDIAVNSASSLQFSTQIHYIVIPLVLLNIAIFMCGVVLIPRLTKSGDSAKWTMRLLLFCPPAVVLHSHPISKILSNDFSINDGEENQEKSHFYEAVVSHINEAAVFIDDELVVRSVNSKFEELFGNEKIGTSLFDVFDAPLGMENSLRAFKKKLYDILMVKATPTFEGEMTVMANSIDDESDNENEDDNDNDFENNNDINDVKNNKITNNDKKVDEIYEEDEVEKVTQKLIRYLLIGININGQIQKKPILSDGISFYTMILTDLSKIAKKKAKIAEENAKSINILSNVLPEKIINEIKIKTANQSFFKVHSASFVFVDIIDYHQLMNNFSPSQFLSSLKNLFESFDSLQKSLGSFVRLSSFCDSYVAAFGLFENNNEEEDREDIRMASFFAVDAITLVYNFNNSNGVELSVKVGCSNGGPIVAGLIDLNAPAFGAFGWPIQLAADLAKKSAPMKIHMTQTMFELGFEEDDFLNVEENAIEYDGKHFDTYIVYECEEEN